MHAVSTIRLPGVALDVGRDQWAAARRGHHPPNFGRTFPAEPLSPSEVLALFRACDSRRDYVVARDQALLTVLWRSGLRIAEALAVCPKDLDLPHGAIRVLRGKGTKDRVVGIDPMAVQFLERWLRERARRGIPASAPLFCTVLRQRHRGEPWRALSAPYVRNWLKVLRAKADLDKRVHPHGFRHTMTNELVDELTPHNLIQAQLGHDHAASTEAYIAKIAAPELLRAMRERSWPDELGELVA